MLASPSSALNSLLVQSRPGRRHSSLYLRTGTPPAEAGSSKWTTAVLEKGSTLSISGADGTSVAEERETVKVEAAKSPDVAPEVRTLLMDASWTSQQLELHL